MEAQDRTFGARGVDRRSVLKAAAWSVPVISMAVATPLAAASTTPLTCPNLIADQFVVTPVRGAVQPGGNPDNNNFNFWTQVRWEKDEQGNGIVFPPTNKGYLSIRNNTAQSTDGTTITAIFDLTTQVEIPQGWGYQIDFDALGQYGNDALENNRHFQRVEFLVNGNPVWTATTDGSDPSGAHLTNAGPIAVSHAAVADTELTTLTFRFSMPDRPRDGGGFGGANDDIIVSLPKITCIPA